MVKLYSNKNVTCTLFRILAVTSVCSTVLNIMLLSISLSTGRWVFGDLFCQIFAFFSHCFVAVSVWLAALTTIERYFKLVLPDDHRSVFSEINTKLLVMGLYLLVAFILFNPIYGWGEYSEYKGHFQLVMHIKKGVSNSSFLPSSFTDCSVYNGSYYKYPGDKNSTTDLPNIVESSLKTFQFFTRIMTVTPEKLIIALRTSNKESLDHVLKLSADGALGSQLLPEFPNCDIEDYLCVNFVINKDLVEGYEQIFVPFQVTNMCTVDFTTINKGAWGWILLYTISTCIGPYCIIYTCTIIIGIKWQNITWDNSTRDLIQTKRFLMGCVIGSLMYFPYFFINLSNYFGYYVSPTLTIIVMFSYYCSSLVPCVFLNPQYLCKSRIRSPTTASIHDTDSDEPEDIEMDNL